MWSGRTGKILPPRLFCLQEAAMPRKAPICGAFRGVNPWQYNCRTAGPVRPARGSRYMAPLRVITTHTVRSRILQSSSRDQFSMYSRSS